MRTYAREHPTEDVVLLDNARQQRKRRRSFEDFAPVDHEADCFLADGNQIRQAVTSFFEGSEGSSRAYPCVNRERHSAASLSSCKRVSARYPRRLKTTPLLNCFA